MEVNKPIRFGVEAAESKLRKRLQYTLCVRVAGVGRACMLPPISAVLLPLLTRGLIACVTRKP